MSRYCSRTSSTGRLMRSDAVMRMASFMGLPRWNAMNTPAPGRRISPGSIARDDCGQVAAAALSVAPEGKEVFRVAEGTAFHHFHVRWRDPRLLELCPRDARQMHVGFRPAPAIVDVRRARRLRELLGDVFRNFEGEPRDVRTDRRAAR